MADHTQDDKLIALPPKDLILSLRRHALLKAENERFESKIEEAKSRYNYLLWQFAWRFFRDSEIYNTFGSNEKKELAKIYASLCRKSLASKLTSFTVITGIVAGLGIWDPATLILSFFGALILGIIFGVWCLVEEQIPDIVYNFFSHFRSSWSFLSARRFLKRLGIDEKEIFLENQKTGS